MQRNIIEIDGQRVVRIPCADVWMSEMELVELFDVIAPTLRAAIRAVYKSGVLNPCEVEKRIKLPNGYITDVYALPMVVALAFRIDTQSASNVRNAHWKSCACEKKGKSCWFQWAAASYADVRLCTL